MVKTPDVYEDVTCCTEDLCNGQMKEDGEKPSESMESDSGPGPTVCYINGGGKPGTPEGELVEYLMPNVDPNLDPSYPRGVNMCMRYDWEGGTAYTIADQTLCDSLKSMP